MSYQMFQQKCDDCGNEWNAAFGIVGRTQVAAPPKVCPKCKSAKIRHLAHGWKMDDGSTFPKPPEPKDAKVTTEPRFSAEELRATESKLRDSADGMLAGASLKRRAADMLRFAAACVEREDTSAKRMAQSLNRVGVPMEQHPLIVSPSPASDAMKEKVNDH